MSCKLTFNNKKFESIVREILNIKCGSITEIDALSVRSLEMSNFSFYNSDIPTLCSFVNLEILDICLSTSDLSFLGQLPNIKELSIEFEADTFDFRYLSNLSELSSLVISGGDLSSFDLIYLDALTELQELKSLWIHEFGTIDLTPIERIGSLEELLVGYGNSIEGITNIPRLKNLDTLTLCGLQLNDLDFLDDLPDSVSLDLCGIEIKRPLNIKKLSRFKKPEISYISVNSERIL